MTEGDDFDTPWKDILRDLFSAAMQRFFPAVHAGIDWARGHEFLDKELQKITRRAKTGRRHVDLLVRVYGHGGDERWLLVHVEVQVQKDADLPARMFVYAYRIFDRYQRPCASLAILADDNPDWRPDAFRTGLWGSELSMRFATAKLLDLDPDDPAHAGNPFNAVIAAHRRALETRRNPYARLRWKIEIVRALYVRGFDRQVVLDVFRFIDWALTLPVELEPTFHQTLDAIEEAFAMPYVTSIERRGIEKGREEGRIEMLLTVLRNQIRLRFGPLDAATEARITAASAEDMLRWANRVIEAESLEDVFGG